MLCRNFALASIAFALSVLAPTHAAATAQRTFVASYGSPANTAFNCSIAKPCRAFSEAISVTNSGGEVIVLDSAGYGSVTITKSVSIIAPPGIYAGVTVSSGNGVTINAPGATVVLRGLSINGQGGNHGVVFQQGSRLRIENCVVSSMGAVGIYHQASNGEMIVLDTLSRDNGDGGIALVAINASILLDHVRSEHNVNVGFYMAPVVPSASANATISDSIFAYNGGNGVWADTVGGAETSVLVERTAFVNNAGDGFLVTSGASGAFARITLARNWLNTNGGGIHSLGILPGIVELHASENSGARLISDGNGSIVYAGRNMTGVNVCKNDAVLHSYGDNQTDFPDVITCGTYNKEVFN